MTGRPAAAVLAVDGGNSKAEALLVGPGGRVLAAARSGTVSHQQVGLPGALSGIVALAAAVGRAAGLPADGPIAELGSYCLAGADYPAETRRLLAAIEARRITARAVIRNDTMAALRAGTTRPWGAALICGQGVNGVAVGPTGRVARFAALGDITGDWGGGTSVGVAGLGAAVRAVDGRGSGTVLREMVPAHFGVRSVTALVRALYEGRIDQDRLGELSPVVFAAASAGDMVAGGIVDRLADELATMAVALLRRTGQLRLDAELVLAGGVLRAGHRRLIERLMAGVHAAAPAITPRVLVEPPVLGAAFLGLADAGLAGDELVAAELRLRGDLPRIAWSTVVESEPRTEP